MKESWICRDYKRGDEYQISALFKQVFGREMSLAFWKWRFIDNPFGKGIIKLLFDNDKLIGHYAVIPMNVQVQGRLLKSVFSMTTMTHPDYRGKGIFAYLGEEAYKVAINMGAKFVYGFPNKNSYYGFTHKLGWRDLGKMTTMEKRLQTRTKESSPTKVIKRVERFDDVVNPLWDRLKQGYTCVIPRTEEFLNWRFVENPDADYEKYIISGDNDLLGYVVLKVYTTRDTAKGHIVDILSIADKEVVRLLLEYSYGYFLERGIQDISCWIPESSFYDSILREDGFIREETETYFGVRMFNKDDKLLGAIEDISNWFLSMGDSDVF